MSFSENILPVFGGVEGGCTVDLYLMHNIGWSDLPLFALFEIGHITGTAITSTVRVYVEVQFQKIRHCMNSGLHPSSKLMKRTNRRRFRLPLLLYK